MKSGLEGRNNADMASLRADLYVRVSMKSGLEGRNNAPAGHHPGMYPHSLNEVRPGRPEQWVSQNTWVFGVLGGLNEVRPGRPEQWTIQVASASRKRVSMKSGLEGRNNHRDRPADSFGDVDVSMKSGLEGRNNAKLSVTAKAASDPSQ